MHEEVIKKKFGFSPLVSTRAVTQQSSRLSPIVEMARRAKARRKERICTFDALLTVGLGAVGLITLGQGSRGLARSFASHAAAPSEAPAPLLYLLHVPSSGGTTLCRAAEQFGMRVNSRDNCNLPGGNRAPAALALSGMAVIASADANTTAAPNGRACFEVRPLGSRGHHRA